MKFSRLSIKKLLSSSVHADAFRNELYKILADAQFRNLPYVTVKSGDLHRSVGGYPDRNKHRMPICCDVMYGMMQEGDQVLEAPPKGKGANLFIRYSLKDRYIPDEYRFKPAQSQHSIKEVDYTKYDDKETIAAKIETLRENNRQLQLKIESIKKEQIDTQAELSESNGKLKKVTEDLEAVERIRSVQSKRFLYKLKALVFYLLPKFLKMAILRFYNKNFDTRLKKNTFDNPFIATEFRLEKIKSRHISEEENTKSLLTLSDNLQNFLQYSEQEIANNLQKIERLEEELEILRKEEERIARELEIIKLQKDAFLKEEEIKRKEQIQRYADERNYMKDLYG